MPSRARPQPHRVENHGSWTTDRRRARALSSRRLRSRPWALRLREIALLRRAAKEDKALDDHSFGRADGEGGVVRLSLWNHPGDGIYGMFARCRADGGDLRALLGGEVYHYHSKMIMKDAQRRRGVGVAPGLRLLVRERRPVSGSRQRVHRGGSLPRGRTAASR